MIKLNILQIFNYWYIKYKQNSIIVALKDTARYASSSPMDYVSRAPLSSRPHTSGVRSRWAVGILLSASCPNRSSEAHGTEVSPREWASLRRTLFFYTSPPRSPQQQRIGCKDRLRPDRQLQIWTLFRLRVSFSGGDNLDNLDSSEDKSKTSWEVFTWGENAFLYAASHFCKVRCDFPAVVESGERIWY